MPSQAMVLYDSPEAATFKTGIEGWVSRDGYFYGKDENLARYGGCTHKVCPECGTVYEKSSYCRPCHTKKRAETVAAFPVERWNGETPLCLFDSETFFFGDDVLDWLADHPEDVLICKCKPGHLHQLDEDNWADDLPEDGELPTEVSVALAALNAAIRTAPPSCWWPDDVAIDVADLRSRILTR